MPSLKEVIDNMSDDTRELNAGVIESLRKSTKRGISALAPAMSEPESTFLQYWDVFLKGPPLIQQYVFHPEREWRLDFYEPITRTGFEIHGGIYTRGRHLRPKGFIGDREKINAALELGITVFEIVAPVEYAEVEKVLKHVRKQIAKGEVK